MERITVPMFRYGEPDWDKDYMKWGLHDEATQIEEAESVLCLVEKGSPLRMLDLACGIGRHAVYWARRGHQVTAVDISETFIEEGRKRAREKGVSVSFEVRDIRNLPYREQFDVVTWIEGSFFDDEMAWAIHGYLVGGGLFVCDIRNPNHEKAKSRRGDWESWREENGIFYLERHWTDEATGLHHDVWIEINPRADKIIERTNSGKPSGKSWDNIRILRENGFNDIEIRTMTGELFTGREEPYWLWVVATK